MQANPYDFTTSTIPNTLNAIEQAVAMLERNRSEESWDTSDTLEMEDVRHLRVLAQRIRRASYTS